MHHLVQSISFNAETVTKHSPSIQFYGSPQASKIFCCNNVFLIMNLKVICLTITNLFPIVAFNYEPALCLYSMILHSYIYTGFYIDLGLKSIAFWQPCPLK